MERKDKITIAIGLIGAIFGIVNTYYLFFRGPDTQLSFSPSVYFIGPDLIGIGCTFSNLGGHEDTINFLTVEVEGENQILRPVWVASGTHQWLLEKERREEVTREPQFTNFSSIAIPSKSTDSRIVWFTSDGGYRFQARDYRLLVKGYSSDFRDVRTRATLEFSVSPEDQKRLEQHPDLEISIRQKAWMIN